MAGIGDYDKKVKGDRGYRMKGSPFQRNFGIGVANSSGASGLSPKGSPMKWAWLLSLGKAALGAAKVGAAAIGTAATKGAAAIATKLGAKGLAGKLATMSGKIGTWGAAGKTAMGAGMKAFGKTKVGEFLASKEGKWLKSRAAEKLMGASKGEDYEARDVRMPQLSFAGSAGARRGDLITQASGLTYKIKKY